MEPSPATASRYPAIAGLARAVGKPFWIVDVEATTGDVRDPQFGIVEVGFVRVEPDGSHSEDSFLVDAGFPMNPYASRVTGIKSSLYHGAPDYAARWPAIEKAMRECVVSGFGVHDLDCRALMSEAERHLGDALERFPISSLDARSLWRIHSGSDKGQLAEVAEAFGKKPEAKHRALADARAAADALEGLALAMGLKAALQPLRSDWSPLAAMDQAAREAEAASLALSGALKASLRAGALASGLAAMERAGARPHFSRKGLSWWIGATPARLEGAPSNPEELCAHFGCAVPASLAESDSLARCSEALLGAAGLLTDEAAARAALCRSPGTASAARAKLISQGGIPPWAGVPEFFRGLASGLPEGASSERGALEELRARAISQGVSPGHPELASCAASLARERGLAAPASPPRRRAP